MTVKEVITAALQEIGIVPAGSDPTSADLAWALSKFNRMLKSWSANCSTLYYRVTEGFSLVGGTASYTIGTGATFSTARPNIIAQAFIRDSANIDHEVKVRPIAEYWSLFNKTNQDRPTRLFYDPAYASGFGTIYLYYTPRDVETLYIVSQKPLTTYTSELTEVSLPGEYEDALVLNFAVACGPAFGRPISQDLRLEADRAYNRLIGINIANNMKPVHLNIVGGGGSYDIDAG